MGAQKRYLVASAGSAWVEGMEVGRIVGGEVSISWEEREAKSGCDIDPWYVAVAGREITGSIEFQLLSSSYLPYLIGGSEVEATGYAVAKDEEQTLASTVTLDNANYHTQADGFGHVWVHYPGTNGITAYRQVDESPADGEFCVLSAAAGTLSFNAADTNIDETAKFTYVYQDNTRTTTKLTDTDRPAYVSLALVGCGADESADNTTDYQTLYLPKVKFIGGMTLAFSDAGTGINTYTASFKAVKDSNGDILFLY